MNEDDYQDEDDAGDVDPYEGKYGFYLEDQHMLEGLAPTVRTLLSRPSLEPQQIAELAAFLYAVERLPMVTEGISMALRLAYRAGGECSYREVRIDQDSVRLSGGGYVETPGVGGDSYGETVFEVSAGGGREGSLFQASECMAVFLESAGDESICVEIDEDFGEPFTQWDQEMPTNPWEGMESEYL